MKRFIEDKGKTVEGRYQNNLADDTLYMVAHASNKCMTYYDLKKGIVFVLF